VVSRSRSWQYTEGLRNPVPCRNRCGYPDAKFRKDLERAPVKEDPVGLHGHVYPRRDVDVQRLDQTREPVTPGQ